MGVKGVRSSNVLDEPTLLGNVELIIDTAKRKGYIVGRVVDIEAIVKDEGIILEKDNMPSSISGLLFKSDDHWVIKVNKNHHIHRQRFTIAHEFAHYILHRDDNQFFEDEVFYRDDNTTSIEYAANSYAASLIIPEDLLTDAIRNGIVSIRELSEEFNVSMQAIKSRVENIGYKFMNDEE